MRTDVVAGLQVLRRTTAFLEEEINVPAKMGPIGKHLETLKAVTEQLAVFARDQEVNDRAFRLAAHKAKELALAITRQYVRPVGHAGKVLFPQDAGFRTALKMPNSGAVSYEEVIASAEGIAVQVEERKAEFVRAGFGEDFVDRLRGAIVELRKALDERGDHYGRRSQATAGMIQEFGRGREMVKMMNAMVAPLLSAERLARWKTLSRFARVKGGETGVPAEVPEVTGSTLVAPSPAGNGTTSTNEGHAA